MFFCFSVQLGLRRALARPFLSCPLAVLFASLPADYVSGGLMDGDEGSRRSTVAAVSNSLLPLTAA